MPLNICHISTMTARGGVEQMLSDFLLSEEHQNKHYLLCTSSFPEIVKPIIDAGVPFFQPIKHYRYDIFVIKQIANWLKENQINVVHSYNAYANTWAYLVTRFVKIPLVTGEHGTVWSTSGLIKFLDKRANHAAMCITANSNATAYMLERRYAVAKQKIRVVTNAVPSFERLNTTSLRKELNITDDEVVVGSIGRLDTPKDFLTLIQTASEVLKQRSRVRFLIVGGGAQYKILEEAIANLNLSAKVSLLGWRDDARNIVQLFDIFVSCSIHETFGNAIVEAMMAGKPVIASNVDGIPEVVSEAGILLTPTEPIQEVNIEGVTPYPIQVVINGRLSSPLALHPTKLAEQIIHLIDAPEQRHFLGAKGQNWVAENFTMQKYKQELETIYLEVAQ